MSEFINKRLKYFKGFNLSLTEFQELFQDSRFSGLRIDSYWYENMKINRTYCKCGHISKESSSTCPSCGGKLIDLRYSHASELDYNIKEDVFNIQHISFEIDNNHVVPSIVKRSVTIAQISNSESGIKKIDLISELPEAFQSTVDASFFEKCQFLSEEEKEILGKFEDSANAFTWISLIDMMQKFPKAFASVSKYWRAFRYLQLFSLFKNSFKLPVSSPEIKYEHEQLKNISFPLEISYGEFLWYYFGIPQEIFPYIVSHESFQNLTSWEDGCGFSLNFWRTSSQEVVDKTQTLQKIIRETEAGKYLMARFRNGRLAPNRFMSLLEFYLKNPSQFPLYISWFRDRVEYVNINNYESESLFKKDLELLRENMLEATEENLKYKFINALKNSMRYHQFPYDFLNNPTQNLINLSES